MNIFANFAKSAANTFIKNKPAIMTGIALVSLGTTVIITLREGPKIKETVDNTKANIDRIREDNESGFTEKEKQKAINDEMANAAKELAVPAGKIALATAITVFSIVGINKAHTAREIAASALLESYKNQIVGYEEKLPDILGKQKAAEVRHDVICESAEKLSEKYGTNKEKFKEIKYTDKVPMIDDFGNRWIASKDELDRALNYMTRDMNELDRNVNYYDFLTEYFSEVETRRIAKKLWFDKNNFAKVEATPYEDKLLNTVAYEIHFTAGEPVPERYLKS